MTRRILGSLLLCLIAFCCTSLLACTSGSETLDPDKLPYKLEDVFHQPITFWFVDLDGDGYDERVYIDTPPRPGNLQP